MCVQSQLKPLTLREIMKLFSALPLVLLNSALDQLINQMEASGPIEQAKITPKELRNNWAQLMEGFLLILKDADLEMTKIASDRMIQSLRDPVEELTGAKIVSVFSEVQHRLFDELDSKGKFFRIPIQRAQVFDKPELFGSLVSKKFPRTVEDIAEAGNCYAAGRYTACVFHLMRVMEHSVQRLGSKMKIQNVERLVWQVILDQVNKSIAQMPPKQPKTKRLAEVAAHLYNVKLAWRNEVMHPKSTYTEEEAEFLLAQVAVFMQTFAKVV